MLNWCIVFLNDQVFMHFHSMCIWLNTNYKRDFNISKLDKKLFITCKHPLILISRQTHDQLPPKWSLFYSWYNYLQALKSAISNSLFYENSINSLKPSTKVSPHQLLKTIHQTLKSSKPTPFHYLFLKYIKYKLYYSMPIKRMYHRF